MVFAKIIIDTDTNGIGSNDTSTLQLKGSMKEPNILIYFFFPPITQWCSISDVLFIGWKGSVRF